MALTKVRGTGVESIQTLTIADGLTLSDGDVTLASGHGVSFGATSDGGLSGTSMTSEVLDDYEEGDFSPTFTQSGATIGYSSQAGVYTKIGRMVHATGRLFTSSISGGSGTVTLTGLPFTAVSGFDSASVYFCSTFGGWSSTNCPQGGFISNGTASISMKSGDSSDARNQTDATVTSFSDATVGLIFNVTYVIE